MITLETLILEDASTARIQEEYEFVEKVYYMVTSADHTYDDTITMIKLQFVIADELKRLKAWLDKS